MKTTPIDQSFDFHQGKKKLVVLPSQIVRLEAISNYTRIYFIHHPPILMACVLKTYDRLLSPFGFIRTHRTHLVNSEYIEALDNLNSLRLKDESHAEISRRKRKMVLSLFSTEPIQFPQHLSA